VPSAKGRHLVNVFRVVFVYSEGQHTKQMAMLEGHGEHTVRRVIQYALDEWQEELTQAGKSMPTVYRIVVDRRGHAIYA